MVPILHRASLRALCWHVGIGTGLHWARLRARWWHVCARVVPSLCRRTTWQQRQTSSGSRPICCPLFVCPGLASHSCTHPNPTPNPTHLLPCSDQCNQCGKDKTAGATVLSAEEAAGYGGGGGGAGGYGGGYDASGYGGGGGYYDASGQYQVWVEYGRGGRRGWCADSAAGV